MSDNNASKGYIVRRELQDNGPNGSVYGYVRVERPAFGETYYKGTFRRRQISCGQYDADSMTVYDYIGEGKPEQHVWRGADDSVETF